MTGGGDGRQGRLIALAVAVAAVLSASTAIRAEAQPGVGPRQTIAPPQTRIGFWAGESVPGTDYDVPSTYWKHRDTHFYTPRLWRVLREERIPLYFNLRYERDFGPVPADEPQRHDALRIIRTANRLGVPVWGWVLIPYSDGYWAWEGAASEQFRAVRSLVHWTHTKRVRLSGIALDPEPPPRPPYGSTAAILGAAPPLPSLFQATIDPAAQCAAWRTYARIPRWAERHDLNVSAAPMPAALDDIGDGNLALQDATNFVLPETSWHELFFQAYRSVFAYHSGHDPGPGIVASYLRSAHATFGSVGQVSLGSAGRGPYKHLSALVHDVRLAATLGARVLPIYSLERTLRAYGGPRAVLRLARAAKRPLTGPSASRAGVLSARASELRATIRRADRAATRATPSITAG
ncbi:MAG TPA: hypothetical protein VJQ84_11370, partial [Solirubrobacterales bacterium]|nr:hypothetical protein [Solirubrobacterales bacterium]